MITERFDCSVAIIAVTDAEDHGIRSIYPLLKEYEISGDDQKYYVCEFNKNGTKHNIVYARQNQMGMVAATALAMKIIALFKPKYLFTVGLAAGIASTDTANQMYGDVVVASEIWDYSSGKFVMPEKGEICYGNIGFISRPAVINTDPGILEQVKKAAASARCQNHVHIGRMACGTSVVANREVIRKQIHSKYSNTIGLDMESYGIAYAAQHSVEPRPVALTIKSVCDYADSEKNDKYQKFAACTAAEFTKFLYEEYLL